MNANHVRAIHAKAKVGYAYAEHASAVAYAVCEYAQLHVLVALVAAVLLGLAAIVVAVAALQNIEL